MKSEIDKTMDIYKRLASHLGGILPDDLRSSQLLVDLADIHEICTDYMSLIDKLLEADASDDNSIQDILYKIDTVLFEHLPYHHDSLKVLLPKFINAVDSDAAEDKE